MSSKGRRLSSDSEEEEDTTQIRKRRRSAQANKKVKSLAEGSSSGSSESDGEEEYVPSSSKKKAVKKGKKSQETVEDSDSDIPEFSYKYGEDLMGDAADRESLESKTEKEREEILMKRYEDREKALQRYETMCRLHEQKKAMKKKQGKKGKDKKEKKKKSRDDEEEDDDDVSPVRRRGQVKDDKKTKAMEKLKAQRKRANAKAMEQSSPSSESESEYDDKSASDDGSYNSDVPENDDEEEEDRTPAELVDIAQARLSRFKLAKWCHAPFFKSTVIGAFVRINIGHAGGNPVYRVAQIKDVKEASKVYQLERTKTNLSLMLSLGKDSRAYRMEYVSNREFKDQEYQFWVAKLETEGVTRPTRGQIEKTRKAIDAALNHTYERSEIHKIVEKKRQFQAGPVNLAYRKTELVRDEQIALQKKDEDGAKKIREELEKVEAALIANEQNVSKTLSGIATINKRNRQRNKMRIEPKNNVERPESADPFTRRKTNPTLAARKKKEGEEEEPTNVEAAPTEVKPTVKKGEELYDEHNFELDIEIDLPDI